MIIRGIAASASGTAIDGHVLLAGSCFDLSQRPPLFEEHRRPISTVLHMQTIGDNLHIVAKSDDPAALHLGLSVAGRPTVRPRQGDVWHVSKFHPTEISLVRSPVNELRRVLEHRPSDPLH